VTGGIADLRESVRGFEVIVEGGHYFPEPLVGGVWKKVAESV
jgi:hypothetical protein